jgi:site-specific recombinase XerD
VRNTSTGALYRTLGTFDIFSHYSIDKVVKRDGTNMPFMIWPDGTPCLLANLYILSLRDRKGRAGRQGLSRKGNKGGTMGEYAAKLSQLIRLCYLNQINFQEVNDSVFTSFISHLREERSSRNPTKPRKTESTLIATGKIWLDFFCFLGRFYETPHFVSANGNIRAVEHFYTLTTQNGRQIQRSYLHHHSFGPEYRKHRRNPITNEQIKTLKAIIPSSSKSKFIMGRRRCLIDLLEHTGARRSEVGNVRVEDIIQAYKMEHPLLRLETLKQGDDATRFIPVTKMLLHDILTYIRADRRKLLKTVQHHDPDQGYLFISETTGRKLSNETITNEILTLKKAAGLEEQICPHMFRHAFITNLFSLFIQRHEIENADNFRRALLDSQTFLAEITQWTGHIETSSLETYINLAFQNLARYSKTLTSVHLVRAMEIFDEKHNNLIQDLENGLSLDEYKRQLAKLVSLRDLDFESARERALI